MDKSITREEAEARRDLTMTQMRSSELPRHPCKIKRVKLTSQVTMRWITRDKKDKKRMG